MRSPVESYTATRAYDSAGHPVTKFDVAVWVPSGLLFNFTTLDVVSTFGGAGHQVVEPE